jgi:hypothetical protein
VGPDDDAEHEPAEDDNDVLAEAGGEVARAGESKVTKAQHERDWTLAWAVAAGCVSGILATRGAVAGVLGATFAPLLPPVMTSFQSIFRRRVEHSAETLVHAADTADLPVDEFFSKAVSDDRRHELFTSTLTFAQDAAWREKRRAFGRALANGVMGDDARITEELLFVRALGDIDEIHVHLLGRLAVGGYMTAANIVLAEPGLERVVLALLSQLQSHGLIESESPVTPGGAMTPVPQYSITSLGRTFLARLTEDAS